MLFATDNSVYIKAVLKDLFMECHRHDSYSRSCCISRIQLLFALLLRQHGSHVEFYEKKSDSDHPDFVRLLHYIQKNYATITLDSLADAFGYHPVYLSRLIRKKTGRTLTDIQTNLRMEKAKHLLLSTDLKIKEITERVGYDSSDHFSRLFKKTYQSSPSQFRAQQKKEP